MTNLIRHLAVLAIAVLTLEAKAMDATTSAHQFNFTAIEGPALPLDQFAGKVVVLVNTASQCGYTKQYTDLQALWTRYRDQGLVVLGVPSNDFGGQEPGSAEQIKEFCEVNFDVDFPLTDKVKVKGPDAHPFYRWAEGQLGADQMPRWNFHKLVIAPDGKLAAAFPSATKPTDPEITTLVEKLLAAR